MIVIMPKAKKVLSAAAYIKNNYDRPAENKTSTHTAAQCCRFKLNMLLSSHQTITQIYTKNQKELNYSQQFHSNFIL